MNDFSVALFNEVSKENAGKNVFFSPFSVSSAMSILLLGVRDPHRQRSCPKGLHVNDLNVTGTKNPHMLFKDVRIALCVLAQIMKCFFFS